MHPPRVVVAGSINMDLVIRSVALPKPGETCCGKSFTQIHGGKGANQAVAAARLGAQVSMVGRIGGDAFGEVLSGGLRREGISMDHVQRSCDVTSGLAFIHVDDLGQNCITVIPGANGCVTPEDVDAAESVIAAADILLLQLEIPLPAVKTAIEVARRHGIRILLDPAPAQMSIDVDLLRVDVICPNETEAEVLTGMSITTLNDALAAAERLCRFGAGLGIVTLGGRGVAWCASGGKAQRQPPFAVDVTDTTAAGDAFAAALGIALAEGHAPTDAIRFATAAGALATTRHGAQPAMPQRNEIEHLMSAQTPA